MKTVLTNGQIVLPTGIVQGDVVIEPPFIAFVGGGYVASATDNVVDVHGAYIMAGVVDSHVHFREPGMIHNATIASESRAAAAGGVTSVLEMPNCIPPTTTEAALQQKQAIAARDSVVNYAFFIGATHDNIDVLRRTDYSKVPGIKVFMGSSTGGMLLDNAEALRSVFSLSSVIPVVTHCEDTNIIEANAARYGDTSDFSCHPLIRSREACIASSRLAISLAQECNTRLHVAHITTAEEIAMFGRTNMITAEVCVPHLLFTDADYGTLGSLIKCNPAVKTADDRDALRHALVNGMASTIATDHAPHTYAAKAKGGCRYAPSGMPLLQFSLRAMMKLSDEGVLPLSRLTALMSADPARLFGMQGRGELREGAYADIVVVERTEPYVVSDSDVLSLCAWTPLAGRTLQHRVRATYVNGHLVWDGTKICTSQTGEQIVFNHA